MCWHRGCRLGFRILWGMQGIWISPRLQLGVRSLYSSSYCHSQRTQQNWSYIPALDVWLPSPTGKPPSRLFLTFPYLGLGAPGISEHAGAVSGVSIGASGLVISFAEDSRTLDCMGWISLASSTYASSLAGVLLLSLPIPRGVRESFSSNGVLEVAFDISPVSESSSFGRNFICFLGFLPMVAGGASISEVSPFFVVFLVFLWIEEATGTSASDGGAVDFALGGMAN